MLSANNISILGETFKHIVVQYYKLHNDNYPLTNCIAELARRAKVSKDVAREYISLAMKQFNKAV